MRKLEKLFLTGCGYAILILTLFYTFAAVTKFTATAIAPAQFFLILLFGFIIALAELMYNLLNLKKVFRCLIHYAVLLVAFCVIFVISGNIAAGKASSVFVAVIIFTMLYFAIWFTVHLVRKTISAADDKLDRRLPKRKEEKNTYKPLYKDADQ